MYYIIIIIIMHFSEVWRGNLQQQTAGITRPGTLQGVTNLRFLNSAEQLNRRIRSRSRSSGLLSVFPFSLSPLESLSIRKCRASETSQTVRMPETGIKRR